MSESTDLTQRLRDLADQFDDPDRSLDVDWPAATVVTMREAAAGIAKWREWAQFIYLGGGPVTLDDNQLRVAVNAAHDSDIAAAEARADAAARERDRLRAKLVCPRGGAHYCPNCDNSLEVLNERIRRPV